MIPPPSSLKHTRTVCSTATKNTLNVHVGSTHPCRSPCLTPNHSQLSPSSVRARARMPGGVLLYCILTTLRQKNKNATTKFAVSYKDFRSLIVLLMVDRTQTWCATLERAYCNAKRSCVAAAAAESGAMVAVAANKKWQGQLLPLKPASDEPV